MNSPEGTEIIKRLYEAVDILIDAGEYNSYLVYCKTYGIDASHFYKTQKEPGRLRPHYDWFVPLFVRHGLDGLWVFSGKGKPFKK